MDREFNLANEKELTALGKALSAEIRISPASSKTRIFKAAEEGGISNSSATSFPHRGPFPSKARILIRISEESALPNAVSTFSLAKLNSLSIYTSPLF